MLLLNLFIVSCAILLGYANAQGSNAATPQGCYADTSGAGGPLEPPGIKIAAGSAPECSNSCVSYAFAGWDGRRCFCGNSLNVDVLRKQSNDTCAGIDISPLRPRFLGGNIVIYALVNWSSTRTSVSSYSRHTHTSSQKPAFSSYMEISSLVDATTTLEPTTPSSTGDATLPTTTSLDSPASPSSILAPESSIVSQEPIQSTVVPETSISQEETTASTTTTIRGNVVVYVISGITYTSIPSPTSIDEHTATSISSFQGAVSTANVPESTPALESSSEVLPGASATVTPSPSSDVSSEAGFISASETSESSEVIATSTPPNPDISSEATSQTIDLSSEANPTSKFPLSDIGITSTTPALFSSTAGESSTPSEEPSILGASFITSLPVNSKEDTSSTQSPTETSIVESSYATSLAASLGEENSSTESPTESSVFGSAIVSSPSAVSTEDISSLMPSVTSSTEPTESSAFESSLAGRYPPSSIETSEPLPTFFSSEPPVVSSVESEAPSASSSDFAPGISTTNLVTPTAIVSSTVYIQSSEVPSASEVPTSTSALFISSVESTEESTTSSDLPAASSLGSESLKSAEEPTTSSNLLAASTYASESLRSIEELASSSNIPLASPSALFSLTQETTTSLPSSILDVSSPTLSTEGPEFTSEPQSSVENSTPSSESLTSSAEPSTAPTISPFLSVSSEEPSETSSAEPISSTEPLVSSAEGLSPTSTLEPTSFQGTNSGLFSAATSEPENSSSLRADETSESPTASASAILSIYSSQVESPSTTHDLEASTAEVQATSSLPTSTYAPEETSAAEQSSSELPSSALPVETSATPGTSTQSPVETSSEAPAESSTALETSTQLDISTTAPESTTQAPGETSSIEVPAVASSNMPETSTQIFDEASSSSSPTATSAAISEILTQVSNEASSTEFPAQATISPEISTQIVAEASSAALAETSTTPAASTYSPAETSSSESPEQTSATNPEISSQVSSEPSSKPSTAETSPESSNFPPAYTTPYEAPPTTSAIPAQETSSEPPLESTTVLFTIPPAAEVSSAIQSYTTFVPTTEVNLVDHPLYGTATFYSSSMQISSFATLVSPGLSSTSVLDVAVPTTTVHFDLTPGAPGPEIPGVLVSSEVGCYNDDNGLGGPLAGVNTTIYYAPSNETDSVANCLLACFNLNDIYAGVATDYCICSSALDMDIADLTVEAGSSCQGLVPKFRRRRDVDVPSGHLKIHAIQPPGPVESPVVESGKWLVD